MVESSANVSYVTDDMIDDSSDDASDGASDGLSDGSFDDAIGNRLSNRDFWRHDFKGLESSDDTFHGFDNNELSDE